MCNNLLYQYLIVPLFLFASGASVPAAEPAFDDLLDRVEEAHGGTSLQALNTLSATWQFTDALIYESKKPGPPWDIGSVVRRYAIDFVGDEYAHNSVEDASGYYRHGGRLLNSQHNAIVDHRTHTYRYTDEPLSSAAAELFRYSPVALLRWGLDNPGDLKPVGYREDDEGKFFVFKVAVEEGTYSVLVDAETYRVAGVDHSLTDYDGTPIPIRIRFSDYESFDGVLQPTRLETEIWGNAGRHGELKSFEPNADITVVLGIPDGYVETAGEQPGIRDFRVEELAEGVYFVGEGVMYQLFVEFDDFIVALDGCSGNVNQRIATIQQVVPDKPIRYVLASHHHNDHMHGLDEFAKLGAEILAVEEHIPEIRRRLGNTGAEIVTVDGRFEIESGGRVLEIVDIGPLPHSDHMLAGYLPDEKILFEADLFVLGGRREPVRPASSNGRALWETINGRGWEVDLIVDPHSPLIATIQDLESAVNTPDLSRAE